MSSIPEAMKVFRGRSFSGLKTLMTEPAAALRVNRSSWDEYLMSVAALTPNNPWNSLNRVAQFLEQSQWGEAPRRITQIIDTFLAFPRAVSTRMDWNGKHVLLNAGNGIDEAIITEAVVKALRGAHVTLLTDGDNIPTALSNPDSPIQCMSSHGGQLVSLEDRRPMECMFLSSLRLIRPMMTEKTEFELPDEIVELLTFLDPKEAKIFQLEEVSEFIDIINGLGEESTLTARPVELELGRTLTSTAVKHAALAWINPLSNRIGNRLIVPPHTDPSVKQFVKFTQRHLGFDQTALIDTDRLVVRNNACDSDPFMLASQHLTINNLSKPQLRIYPSKTVKRTTPENPDID